MPYMQMTEEQFKVPVLKNVIYALRLVWQTDKRLLIGYLLQEGLYADMFRLQASGYKQEGGAAGAQA